MKKEELPQDLGALGRITKEVCYVVDESGRYTTDLSKGWEVKSKALDAAWEDISDRVRMAEEKIRRGEASPLLYFMEHRLMDIPILSAYTGIWQWRVKRHIKPAIFKKLSDRVLAKYAEAFDIGLEELKSFPAHEA